MAWTAIVVFALSWSIGSSLAVYPHSLSYFNELVGGPTGGPRHLLDSNIDWGQDIFHLKDWLDRHRNVKLDGLSYWGSFPTTLAGIPRVPLPPTCPDDHSRGLDVTNDQDGPHPGWYALSVNHIFGRDHLYRYFLRFDPCDGRLLNLYLPRNPRRSESRAARARDERIRAEDRGEGSESQCMNPRNGSALNKAPVELDGIDLLLVATIGALVIAILLQMAPVFWGWCVVVFNVRKWSRWVWISLGTVVLVVLVLLPPAGAVKPL